MAKKSPESNKLKQQSSAKKLNPSKNVVKEKPELKEKVIIEEVMVIEEKEEQVHAETLVVVNDDEDQNKDEDQNDDDDEEMKEATDNASTTLEPPHHDSIQSSKGVIKQRCLVLCSRGVTARYRHLLEDIRNLLPHHKKDAKLDTGRRNTGGVGRAVNEIAEMKSCNSVLFLECRKRTDCYMWLSETPHGPSAKFHISNVHTMDELRLTGNCMKGSRPILSFDESFDRVPHLKLLKVLYIDVFGTPKGHPKSKPFVDRVMSFYYADKKIWVRNYQILEEQASNAKEVSKMKHNDGLSTSLVEIGPRFVMTPIRIFGGSFQGQTLYQNADFVSPNEVRSQRLKALSHVFEDRKKAQDKRKERQIKNVLPEDPLASVFK